MSLTALLRQRSDAVLTRSEQTLLKSSIKDSKKRRKESCESLENIQKHSLLKPQNIGSTFLSKAALIFLIFAIKKQDGLPSWRNFID